MNSLKKNSLETAQKASHAVRKKTTGYIAAGLGLIAGLAWNDAIKEIIDAFIPTLGSTIVAKLLYAVILTLVVSVVLMFLEREDP